MARSERDTFPHAKNKSTPRPSPWVLDTYSLSCGCGGNFSKDSGQFSCTLLKACHDRCTFGHVYFSKNGLASCTALKHAHSSTDSACIVVTTVNTGQTHRITTALRVCILYLCVTYRKSQQVKHLLTPTG